MRVVGIDFGTSTTAVARLATNKTEMVTDPEGDRVIPSAVAFPPSGQIQFGKAARSRRMIDPKNSLYSFKRIIGRPTIASEVKEFRRRYPFEMKDGDDGYPRFVTRAAELTAVQVAGHMLAHVRDYPALNGKTLDAVCLAVPPSFNSAQRRATVKAALLGGLPEVEIIDEPHAAALTYLGDASTSQTVVVYDLGGGTFDLAVLRSYRGHVERLATGGEPFLGGDDIDHRATKWVVKEVLKDHHWDIGSDPRSLQVLLHIVEQAKVRLSQVEETSIGLARVDAVLAGKTVTLTRQRLESLAADLVRQTFVVCDEVMAQASVHTRDVDAVVLSGGSTYMPAVRAAVGDYFGRPPVSVLPPDTLVARGAAIKAGQSKRS